ncbi:MAG TPA: ATP-binding protein [Syntrophales bacterium]|nr:ATP-binding protein [Syntrophales bacterium]
MNKKGREGKNRRDITREKLLSSILTIGRMLTRPVPIDAVLNAIVRETQKFFELNRVAIFLINKETRMLECRYLAGFVTEDEVHRALTRPLHLDRHNCRETLVARTGQTLFIKDRFTDPRITAADLKMDEYWKRISTITAPLKIRREIIGVLEGDSTQGVLNLSRKDISLFTFFANQAGIIVENARLQAQNKRKIDQFLLLQQLTNRSGTVDRIREFMAVIAANAMKITEAQGCEVALVKKDGKTLVVSSRKGSVLSDARSRATWRAMGGRVAQTGVPAIIYNTKEEAVGLGQSDKIKSALFVPMICEKEVLGVISVFGDRIGAFTKNDMEILSVMANHTAVLLRNANLYEQVIAKRDLAENILESSPNGIITIDGDNRVQSINTRAEQILEIRREDLSGRHITELGSAAVNGVLRAALKNDQRHGTVEVCIEKRNGETAILEIESSFVKNLEGNRPGIIVTIQDVTKERATEEAIRRMDRLTSLGQLSAGIAHEIRNPLAGINLNIQMLAKRMAWDEQAMELINDSLRGIERINSLVKNILDFARPAVPQSQKCYIRDVIMETVRILEPQCTDKNIKVTVDLPDSIPPMVFDKNQIRQVLLNIVINGVESMSDGGEIRITGAVNSSGHKKGGKFRLAIMDNGGGIRRDHLPKIFDPFFTTKPDGTGLGLSIVHKILEQHNAAIEVESVEGKGTKFVLTFPMETPAP